MPIQSNQPTPESVTVIDDTGTLVRLDEGALRRYIGGKAISSKLVVDPHAREPDLRGEIAEAITNARVLILKLKDAECTHEENPYGEQRQWAKVDAGTIRIDSAMCQEAFGGLSRLSANGVLTFTCFYLNTFVEVYPPDVFFPHT